MTPVPTYRDIDRLEEAGDARAILRVLATIEAAHRGYVAHRNRAGGFSGQQTAHVRSLRRRHRYALAAARRLEG